MQQLAKDSEIIAAGLCGYAQENFTSHWKGRDGERKLSG